MAATTVEGIPILPTLAGQLEYLKIHSPVPMRVEQIRKGHRNAKYADRFTVFVPCCLGHVKWDVLYSSQNAELAPDVIFESDDLDFQPLITIGDEHKIPATWALLRDWTSNDRSRLLRLLMELRALYLKHQRRRVEVVDNPRVKFEIDTMCQHPMSEGIEMRVCTGGDGYAVVQFAVPLNIDLSYLSSRLKITGAKLWGGISLQVTFPIRKTQSFQQGGETPPQLKLHESPALKDVFDVDDVKLPTFPDERCLLEYIPSVEKILREQVAEAINSIGLRQIFVDAIEQTFGRPLEVEAVFFRRLSLIVTSGLFCFLIHMVLPTNFPKQQPALTFQSSQYFDVRGKPVISRPFIDYPWSPRWEASHMAQRILDFVAEESDRFKKHCTDVLQGRQ